MSKCPYAKEHDCTALELHKTDKNRYPFSPCTPYCNQLRILELETRLAEREKKKLT